MSYLNWSTKVITDFSPENIETMYDAGYVFTRVDKGVMNQTRSFRIKLSDFELSSENRRILKKTENVELVGFKLPYAKYDFTIGKLAKDFYDTKFGKGTMSVNKIKEMMTDKDKSNFNCLFTYVDKNTNKTLGYAICYTNNLIHHYSYPFYDLSKAPDSMGLGMMIRAIEVSKKLGHKYIYLGSLQRPTDTYKLQFKGQEWFTLSEVEGFDKGGWQTDTAPLKEILK